MNTHGSILGSDKEKQGNKIEKGFIKNDIKNPPISVCSESSNKNKILITKKQAKKLKHETHKPIINKGCPPNMHESIENDNKNHKIITKNKINGEISKTIPKEGSIKKYDSIQIVHNSFNTSIVESVNQKIESTATSVKLNNDNASLFSPNITAPHISRNCDNVCTALVAYESKINNNNNGILFKINENEIHKRLIFFNAKYEMTNPEMKFTVNVNSMPDLPLILADISNGIESISIPCINNINGTLPDINYITQSIIMSGVPLNSEPEFLSCCDCTDNCEDESKCACIQLTIQEAQHVLPSCYRNLNFVYNKHKHLEKRILTGIYECNKLCKCSNTCLNRVAQHPISQKLEMYMTEKKGWGVRCLNDIPKGTFICNFIGEIFTDNEANKGGIIFGDEYLTDMDFIETTEEHKSDYESDAYSDDDLSYEDDPSDNDYVPTDSDNGKLLLHIVVCINIILTNVLLN